MSRAPLLPRLQLVALTALLGVGAVQNLNAQSTNGAMSFTRSADGVRIAYQARGAGSTALVFVHGWSCDYSYWSNQMDTFAGQYRVVAMDLGGHGASGTGRSSWTMESFGDDVAEVVKAFELPRVILVGHSMGGDVVAEAAKRLEGRVAGIVWVDAYRTLGAGRSPSEVNAFADRLRPRFVDSTRAFVRSMFHPGADRALVERIAVDMSSAPPNIALNALQRALTYSRTITKTLASLGLPVVAINPDDGTTDVAAMERHGVKVEMVPGVGHFIAQESPSRFNAVLSRVAKGFGDR